MENNKEENKVEVLGQTGVMDTIKDDNSPTSKGIKMNLKTLFLLGLGVVALIVGIIIIVMKFKTEKFTVTFDTDGGSRITSITLKKGEKVSKPKDPTKDEHEFVEWQLDGKKYNFSSSVNKNIKLKAVWEIQLTDELYKITFDTLGGSEIESQEVNGNGQVLKPEDPMKPHNKFVEWQLDGKTYDFDSLVKEDITLQALWEQLPSHEVTLDFDGGAENYVETVFEGDAVSEPNTPEKPGHKFIEWQKDGQKYNFSTPVVDDFRLVAKYEEVPIYNVTFNTDGGSFVETQRVEKGKTVIKPSDPTKDGYTFSGWILLDKEYDFNAEVNEDIILKATWKANES